MRTTTKSIVGILSLGVLASSWSIGQSAETGLVLGEPTSTPDGAPVASPVSSPDATSSPSSAPEPSQSVTGKPVPTKQPSAAKSKTGDAITYKYGVIQLEVVKSGTKISSVNLLQAETRGSDWASVPEMLADAAVAANGSDFANVSGATFTTQAFKSALETALAKF